MALSSAKVPYTVRGGQKLAQKWPRKVIFDEIFQQGLRWRMAWDIFRDASF
jgi:hypothetical protein